MNATATFYNRISILYPIINYFLSPQRNVLVDEVNSCEPGKLLEIGIGDGVYLPLYKGHKVIGVDISEAMIAKAKRFESNDVSLMLMNAEDLSFQDNHFDYVVMSHSIAVTENPDRLLEEVYRVLKSGGRLFILNHFTPDNALRYVDNLFKPIARLLHFRSSFYKKDIKGLEQFSLLKQSELGFGSYYKLLIFSKP